jgi:hypothetical protein
MENNTTCAKNSCEQSGRRGNGSAEIEGSRFWAEIAKKWPDPILLKDLGKLEGFPYSTGYFRNLVTGQTCETELKESVIRIGKFPALRRHVMVAWLTGRTV